MSTDQRRHCLIVGGGVIGLAVALSLARRGAQVRVLERGVRCGEGSSGAAAGMLAAGAEATDAGPFRELCRRSRELWPDWAVELLRTTAVDCELECSGLLQTTASPAVVARWEHQSREPAAEILDATQMAQLVPGLGAQVLAGIHHPDDWHVHSHRVVEALVAACGLLGVVVETGVEVSSIYPGPGDPQLTLADGRTESADFVVVCAGSWSGRLLGLSGAAELAVAPVRGQIVAVDPGRPLLSVILFGDHGYLLQKRSGLVLAGTTEEHVGYQPWPTLAGVQSVVAAAVELLPELNGARFASAWAGLRPHAADGWPLLGRLDPNGRLLLATAHYRNGVLLAPLTGELISRAIFEEADPAELEAFSPGRFL
ncbi:MAG: glycine oxidase ThiO [Candidatus Dormibacteria bacterium]